jgi:hypothetical protein
MILKLVLGTLAFVWILWTARNINPRAVGIMLTFPALNGIVLLTMTDKVPAEIVVGIFPLMFVNSLLPAAFIALCRRLGGRQWLAFAICLAAWIALAVLFEWRAVWAYRWAIAGVAVVLIAGCAAWAFWRLRRTGLAEPAPSLADPGLLTFLRDRAARIFWFFVSFVIVTLTAHAFADAHSLVGRLSALPLVPLFLLHWAVNARRADLDELRIAALIGPAVVMVFLFAFVVTLGFIRTDAGALRPGYWPFGLFALLIEWELTRLAIVGVARLTYCSVRAQ